MPSCGCRPCALPAESGKRRGDLFAGGYVRSVACLFGLSLLKMGINGTLAPIEDLTPEAWDGTLLQDAPAIANDRWKELQ